MKIYDFVSDREGNLNWRVIFLVPGERYGHNLSMVVGENRHIIEPIVRFYAYCEGYEKDFEAGYNYQLVAGYYLSTILGTDRYTSRPMDLALTGLNLVGYVPSWILSDTDMVGVIAWLLNITPDEYISKDKKEEMLVDLDGLLEEQQK